VFIANKKLPWYLWQQISAPIKCSNENERKKKEKKNLKNFCSMVTLKITIKLYCQFLFFSCVVFFFQILIEIVRNKKIVEIKENQQLAIYYTKITTALLKYENKLLIFIIFNFELHLFNC
jgi:hypothetical protein